MKDSSRGWFRVYRQIEDWKYYFSEPFTRAHAWIDLLLLANHKPKTIFKRGIQVNVERGEIAWSEEKLAERWKWSRGKVRRFLKMLETEQQIILQRSRTISKIVVVNYDDYQSDGTTDGRQTVQQTDDRRTTDSTNNKNVKNVKNNIAYAKKSYPQKNQTYKAPGFDRLSDAEKERLNMGIKPLQN